jgi:hypothetical protein
MNFTRKIFPLRRWRWLNLLAVLLWMTISPQRLSATIAMMFCNGNMGSVDGLSTAQINGLRASGMNTLVIFTMGVSTNGDFTYNGTICSNGVYVGPSNWGTLLNQCRTTPSSVTRIEMCIGGWGDTSWANIKSFIAANGNGSGTVLYRNLLALKNALGIDAIDSDDEGTYDSSSAIKFGQMCAGVGLKVTLCPYTNPGYWQAVKTGLGSTCDQIYLQCYDGGAGNNPATWNTYFGGLKVVTGYWDFERDTTFLTKMQVGQNAGCVGGFLWPSCTGCNPPAGPGEMSQYAAWILDTFNPVVTPVTAADIVGSQVTFKVNPGGNNAYQWQVIRAGATNNIPGATNTTLTLANLQLTNTASYQVQVSNTAGLSVSSPGSLTVSSGSGAINNVIASYAAQTGLGFGIPFTPTWTLAPGSVIQGQFPISTNGDFDLETSWGDRNVNSLTAGDSLAISAGGSTTTTSTNYVTCGNGGSPAAGASVIYTLTNSSAGGYNLTNITVYGGWRDGGRDQQAYTVYYSKITAPTTFLLLSSVNYNPSDPAGAPSAARATLRPLTGSLATNVAAVKFDFTSPASENGYCGYAEIGVFGVPISPVVATNTLPVTAADVIGSQVTFTAAFTAGSPLTYQWQMISGGVTNNISDATSTILTLTNLQLTNAASYQLVASNAYGVAVSKPGSLTVNPVPAAQNNVVASFAAQTGTGSGTFAPTWNIVTNGSLIAGQLPSATSGNFSEEISGRTVSALTAGGDLGLTLINGPYGITCSTDYVSCGNGTGPDSSNAGRTLVYTLTASTNGYDLTNIIVCGGWADAGRDQQAYTVSYSTATAPATFIQLATINYNPANAANVQSATRATLTPALGVLATNVAAVKFDFTTPASENGFCGYSQIAVFGAARIAPAVPAVLGAASMAPNNFAMNIGGLVAGRTYLVLSTTNLASGAWAPETNFVATQPSAVFTNSAASDAQKFYRVVGY